MTTSIRSTTLALLALVLLAAPAAGQIRRHPTGVNVNANGATTVFITFGGLAGYVPDEALWCGELVAATPHLGQRCAPGTVFGRAPLRLDRSRTSGQDGFTDIMSIPASVTRRAYQAAADGAASQFFYVRRFVDPSGAGPDQYVPVTCRLAGSGARTPFALLDVRVGFATEEPVLVLRPGAEPPTIAARIAYNGTGRLRGRWEVVLPGEDPPSADDLLTEATLPAELRGTQRRYTEIGRFNVFLPPTGEFTLPGPDPSRLPTDGDGLYMVLLRIEAADDKEGDSDLAAAGAGNGVVHSGAVAGFPIPPLRYYVGGTPAAATGGMNLLAPEEDAVLDAAEPPLFGWTLLPSAVLYRLEIESGGEVVHSALVRAEVAAYRAPSWLGERLGSEPFRWRVVALGAGGRELLVSPWRSARLAPGDGRGGEGGLVDRHCDDASNAG